jgi:hypothetical protein
MGTSLRYILLTLSVACLSASAMTLSDLSIGKHDSGPNLTPKDLNGKVVYVVFWGIH